MMALAPSSGGGLARITMALLLPFVACDTPHYPSHHAHACLGNASRFPFCDTTLAIADRVADLISRLTLQEKVSMTYDRGSEVTYIGLPDINWNQEGLHGLGAQCFSLTPGSLIRCPTVFAAPPALASSWNTSLLLAVGDAISTEMRAYNNFGGNRGYQGRPVDLNVWLPNINIARDPRWGRQVETYSEDPWLTGQLGAAIVRGAQRGLDGGASGGGYLKAIVAVKHATAYQVESNRFGINENISAHDLADTYYPAWQGVIEDGGAVGFMCAYPAVNGVPMCANELFETTLMKETWGMGSATGGGSYVQSDCGAIENVASRFHYAANKTYAAAMALNAGTDVDCGDGFPTQLALAIEMGLTTEDTLDASLTRTYTLQFLAGRFDPLAAQPYAALPFEAIGADAALALAADSAAQGMVLLRNDGGALPLARGGKLALCGPFGNDSSIAGNYFEDICPNAHGSFACVPTLLGALATSDGGAAPSFVQGCAVNSGDTGGIAAAVSACAAADVCVIALGTDGSIAGEGNDRANTALPGSQGALAAAVLAVGKPTVLVLFNGATLAIDAIVTTARAAPLAIVEAWNPGVAGGTPVAAALFGDTNRWGKLPVSWYPQGYFNLLPIQEMDMVLGGSGAGRTYKYYNATSVGAQTNASGALLFSIGFGLSYTTFTLSGDCPGTGAASPLRVSAATYATAPPPPINCTCTVRNTGARSGDEVVQVYVVPAAAAVERGRAALRAGSGPRRDPLAARLLVAFARVTVPPGGSVDVPFSFPVPAFASVSDAAARVVYPGDYELLFSRGHGEDVRVPVRVQVDGGEPLVVRQYPTW